MAFLASSIRLAGDEVFVSLRRQALQVPRNTWLLAVAHVESDGRAPPVLSGRQRQRMVDALLEMARLSGLAGIQIDFDATKSQRTFYSKLVREVQAQKPESIRLSITALATWCWSDDWIRELPIDEAVPMLFRMGREAGTVRRRVVQGEDFLVASCRGSLGVSTDERFAFHPQRERLYVFNPHPWTPAALEGVLKWWRR